MNVKNISSKVLNYLNTMNKTQKNFLNATEKLITGSKINYASDDPVGIGLIPKVKAQIRGIDEAVKNIQDGISETKIIDKGLSAIDDLLLRMRELAIKASNSATMTDSNRTILDAEFLSLKNEITRIAETTQFNSITLLKGAPTTTTESTDFEVKLEWWEDTDIDIHIIQPDTKHAWYSVPNPSNHGVIDVDDLGGDAGSHPGQPHVEHYNVATGDALSGNYNVWINNYTDSAPPTTVTVTASKYRGTQWEEIQTFAQDVNYQVADDPWSGVDGVPPYGEWEVGTFNWQPLSVQQTSVVPLHTGPNNTSSDTFYIFFPDAQQDALGISGTGITTVDLAQTAFSTIDTSRNTLNSYRILNGIQAKALESKIKDLLNMKTGFSAVQSTISDTDFAEGAAKLITSQLGQNIQNAMASYAAIDYSTVAYLVEKKMKS